MNSLITELRTHRLIGILRGVTADQLPGLAQVIGQTELRFVEITMNTPDAVSRIRELVALCQDLPVKIGAGTVRTPLDLEQALNAGASFIVSPGTIPDVVTECVKQNIPCIPGALTPTEVQVAYDLGASCVKLFPVKALGGPSYVKELRGPFNDIPLLACGGVSPTTALDYLQAGCDALAFGASVFRAEWLQQQQWNQIETAIEALKGPLKKIAPHECKKNSL